MKERLQARGLNRAFPAGKEGPQHVLRQVDLTVEEGEFVTVMGPSGSGKSTLLYCISGMDRPTGGSVLFAGQELTGLSEDELARLRLERMGFIFQQHNLLKNLSLLDNILLTAFRLGRQSRSACVERARELMRLTGTQGLEDRDITQASGGQLQRVAICRALINEPEILFGDEPTGALNSASTEEIMEILAGVNSRGTTILLATHDAGVAARSERVLFMRDGRLVSEHRPGKYQKDAGDLKRREQELAGWLKAMGF